MLPENGLRNQSRQDRAPNLSTVRIQNGGQTLPRGFNRPFPSSLVPLFQSESTCETFLMKMSSA